MFGGHLRVGDPRSPGRGRGPCTPIPDERSIADDRVCAFLGTTRSSHESESRHSPPTRAGGDTADRGDGAAEDGPWLATLPARRSLCADHRYLGDYGSV